MVLLLRLILASVIGAGVGLGSVWLALTDPRFERAPTIGPWRLASSAADPYAAARDARSGRLPFGAAEGIALVARADMAGRPIDPRCHYAVSGPLPDASLWTLAVTDADGRPPENKAGRFGFTSRDVIRAADGTVEVVVGPTARPGNFVPTTGLASTVLTLRIYSPAIAANLPNRRGLPTVRLTGCPAVQAPAGPAGPAERAP
jgi:hypothetical protein